MAKYCVQQSKVHYDMTHVQFWSFRYFYDTMPILIGKQLAIWQKNLFLYISWLWRLNSLLLIYLGVTGVTPVFLCLPYIFRARLAYWIIDHWMVFLWFTASAQENLWTWIRRHLPKTVGKLAVRFLEPTPSRIDNTRRMLQPESLCHPFILIGQLGCHIAFRTRTNRL